MIHRHIGLVIKKILKIDAKFLIKNIKDLVKVEQNLLRLKKMKILRLRRMTILRIRKMIILRLKVMILFKLRIISLFDLKIFEKQKDKKTYS